MTTTNGNMFSLEQFLDSKSSITNPNLNNIKRHLKTDLMILINNKWISLSLRFRKMFRTKDVQIIAQKLKARANQHHYSIHKLS